MSFYVLSVSPFPSPLLQVSALDATDLTSVLEGDGPFTVFAPPNDAFDNLLDELRIDINDLLNVPSLDQILLYHVVSGRVSSGDLQEIVDGDGDDTISTVNGQSVRVIDSHKSRSGLALLDRQSDRSLIKTTDIEASNGVIHVVDRVLIPIFDSIADIATSFGDFSILVELLDEADLVDTLQRDGPFTVFAPNNKAFDRLMNELHIEMQDLLDLPILKELLLYHVVSGRVLAEDLDKGDVETVNGQNVEVIRRGVKVDGFEIGGLKVRDAQQRRICVIFGNIEADNGVVHVVNEVLVPEFDSIAQIATSFDDFSILVDALKRANLVEVLDKDGPFTVFAPNNNAFHKLIDQLDITVDDLLDFDNLQVHFVFIYIVFWSENRLSLYSSCHHLMPLERISCYTTWSMAIN